MKWNKQHHFWASTWNDIHDVKNTCKANYDQLYFTHEYSTESVYKKGRKKVELPDTLAPQYWLTEEKSKNKDYSETFFSNIKNNL